MKCQVAFFTALVALVACGCVTTTGGAVKKDDVITTSSGNIMISPPMKGQNHALVKITNPTDQSGLDLCEDVKSGLVKKGYKLVDYPDQANYTIMGRIVQAGETEPQLLKEAYRSRYGTRLSLKEPSNDMLAQAVGGLVSQVSSKSFVVILDLQIQTRQVLKGKTTRQNNKSRIVSGIQGVQASEEETMPLIQDHVTHTVVSMF